ncbi:MAG: hypothetical protein AAB553_04245 [Patescibacteria group bacterium]
MDTYRPLSQMANYLLEVFEKKDSPTTEEEKITVNPIVSKFATWYERLRNAMEFREDEVVLRATIERILKRRLLLGGTGETTGLPLIKELLWARYLPENELPRSIVTKVEDTIDRYLKLRLLVMEKHRVPDAIINDWIYDLMSAEIQYILNPKHKKEVMTNFMFHVLRDDVEILDDTKETKDAQVFMAVRKAFARDDLAFLRYHMFVQYFGKLTPETFDFTVEHFLKGYKEILKQLNYPLKDKIYAYVKRRTAVWFILEDILDLGKDNLKSFLENKEALQEAVFAACETRYHGIDSKVKRAVIRSVIFILMTKVAFAFAIEGTYERIFYGHILWGSMIINIVIPPLLMVVVSFFIRTPGKSNSERIHTFITQLLFEENPQLGKRLVTAKNQKRSGALVIAFDILWLGAFIISFGSIILILSSLEFTIISMGIFTFFLAIVSFLAYRIALLANVYRVGDTQGLGTLLVDFLFMPVIRTGRKLTQSISQVNIFLFLFDFLIEAPFKLLFAFFDQWFYYLHAKSEDLG